jgi:chromosome segregation ATPase
VELCALLTRVTERLQDLHTRRANAEREAVDLRQWAESDRQEIRFAAKKSQEDELRQRADRHDAKAKPFEAEVAILKKQIEQLDNEEKRLRDRMLVP